MSKLKKFLRYILHRILGVPYRPELSAWEIENIQGHDARAYICVDRRGLYWITPGNIENPQAAAAGRSLTYFIGREVLDFDEAIRARLSKLDQTTAPKRTPNLDALLKGGSNGEEK